ncbi:hypothetical protein ES677_08480 [Bizionia gelidisalsuginis]|uniref:Uncharacterized protein n=1 Tax=Bizionia gelidisalsuginis TaxID=291188 RepID=A0ABY3MAB1_9FLAO|nr:hypothetical protein [Bizionia gelidisalsuginis]TYC12687.1 hypothetical protein ES677_08480 [Bizionia gelidisalsuginis]
MKHAVYILFLLSATCFGQVTLSTSFVKKSKINADYLIGIDAFNALYYTKNNVFIKNDGDKETTYSNIQLGNITSANTFNPLKINLFYQAFNTVIILDNRLAEVYKIDFNSNKNYKNVTHISTGSDTTIWIFNQDLQQLEVYDYKTNSTRATTQPVQSAVLDFTSNYNACWLLTENFLYKYSYFGSLIYKIKNEGFLSISESDENIIIEKVDKLLYLTQKPENREEIQIPNLLIKQFFLTNGILYIYDGKFLYQYQLKIK